MFHGKMTITGGFAAIKDLPVKKIAVGGETLTFGDVFNMGDILSHLGLLFLRIETQGRGCKKRENHAQVQKYQHSPLKMKPHHEKHLSVFSNNIILYQRIFPLSKRKRLRLDSTRRHIVEYSK